jgi:methylenetetrahydrofolate--tRNA-(uracil-5-)-methyltransferase
MLGALCHYVTHAEPKRFQPMKANFGLLPPLETKIRNKKARYRAYVERALNHLDEIIPEISREKRTAGRMATTPYRDIGRHRG